MGKHKEKVICKVCSAKHGPSKTARLNHYKAAGHTISAPGRPKELSEKEREENTKQNWR